MLIRDCLASPHQLKGTLSLQTPFHIAFTLYKPMLVSTASLGGQLYPTESELGNLMQSAAEFYRTLWPMAAFEERQEDCHSLVQCGFFRMSLYGAEGSTFTGELRSDERDPDSFWLVRYRSVRGGGRQEILPARKYTV